MRRHARHLGREIVRRGRSRAVRSANTRVVLRSAPREADAGVADGVTLHLVDSHLGGMTMDKLDEAATLAGRNLDVRNFSEALEERAKLVLGDISGQTADEDGSVVGVRELVHRLHGVKLGRIVVGGHAPAAHRVGRSRNRRRHLVVATVAVSILVRASLRGGSGDAHGAIAAIDALHLDESTLLVGLLREADETVTARLAGHGVRHDLG